MSRFPLVQFENAALQIIDGDRGVNYPQKSEFVKSGHCVFLNTGNVTKSGFDFSEIDFISEERDALLRKGKATRNDIVLTTRGTVGNVAFYSGSVPFKNIRINSGMVLLRANPKDVVPYYLYCFLKSDIFKKQVFSNGSGSAQPQLPIGALKNISFPLPGIEIQKKIATILSALDAKIDCNNRINAELEAMAKTLYDYWFVQFDFPDKNGKPYKSSGGKMAYNPTLKREIPEGWKAATLASITAVSNDSLNPADFPDMQFRHFSIPVFDVTKTYGVESGHSIGSNKFNVAGTDLLVSKLNPWFNRVVYSMDESDQICSTEFVVWRCPTEHLKSFLYLIATSQQFISHCVQSATGTSNSHKRVNPTVMMRFNLPYQIEIAKKFGVTVGPFIKKMIVNQREIRELSQLRDWLLPMLMNGQLKVV